METINPLLSWRTRDIERRFGLPGARWTRVTMWFTFILALMATVAFFTVMWAIDFALLEYSFQETNQETAAASHASEDEEETAKKPAKETNLLLAGVRHYADMFIARGSIPYPTVFLGFWVLFSLCIKSSKLRFQKRALRYSILPEDPRFILTPYTVGQVICKIKTQADEADDFILYHRILLTLSNLKNIGRVSDVNSILQSQADKDENTMESSYTMINGFLWAIPILGFIGTVLGLSQAIGNFEGVMDANSELTKMVSALHNVTGGLSTAFETTLVALVIALLLQLFATSIKKSEETFLDDCSEYCLTNVVSRLRLNFADDGDNADE